MSGSEDSLSVERPSFSKPFPKSIGDRLLGGCFALEWPASETGTLSVENMDSNRIPILYRSKLNGRHGLCSSMVNRIKELDTECDVKRKEGVQCPANQFHDLVGKPLCDYYEDELGLYLAECDCIKRDRVPPLNVVTLACRDKARAEDEAIRSGRKLEGRRVMGTAEEPSKVCDILEQYRALNITETGMGEMDYFNHLLGRYMMRAAWSDSMSKALDEEDMPPSPYCVYRPCGDIQSNLVHVPAQDFRAAVPKTCKVDMCQINIGRVGASGGVMEVRDNVFDINCSGGASCKVDDAEYQAVTERIHSGNIQEGDYTYTIQDRQLKCGKYGKCQPNGKCKCDSEWTGPECRTKREPEEVIETDDPLKPPDQKRQRFSPAPAPAPSSKFEIPTWAIVAGSVFVGVALLLGIRYVYISKALNDKEQQ